MTTKRKDAKGRVLRDGEDQLANGMYRFRYTDPYGRHAITSWRLVETDAVPKGNVRNSNPPLRTMEEEIFRKQMNGMDVYKARLVTLNAYFEKYMDSKKGLRETTRTNYRYCYDHAARDTIGILPIGKITYSVMRDFYFSLIFDRGFAPRSIEGLQTVLHPIFEIARKDRIVQTNPTDAIAEVKTLNEWKRGKRHALTEEQQAAFLDFLYTHNSKKYSRWRPILSTLFATGARIGETIGLCWSDIDFEVGIIHIRRELVYYKNHKKGHCSFSISDPKTDNGFRIIPMLTQLKEILSEEYERQKREGFCTSEIDGVSGFVFIGRFNQVVSRASANRAIERIRLEYNAEEEQKAKEENREPLLIPHFSVHNIRHSFASRVVESNKMQPKLLQELMGHADISTTMNIYSEFSQKKKIEMTLDSLDGVLKIC